MRIEAIRKIEKFIKAKINHLFIKHDDFTIISNNCWGTFIYKKYGLPYFSPFVNLVIFAPDYIELLENLSINTLEDISFIKYQDSKYKDELMRLGIEKDSYPIGLLNGKYELHFLHYPSEKDAKQKWLRRIKRMNFDKVIVKFSDGDLFEENMMKRFDNLQFKNKIAFVSKKFPSSPSAIILQKFKGKDRVHDEWKNSDKEFNVTSFINNMHINEELLNE